MNKITTIALATLAVLSTSSSALSSQPAESSPSGPEIVTARNSYAPTAREIRVGKRTNDLLEKQGALFHDPVVSAYLARVA